jgi:hypothetical protein
VQIVVTTSVDYNIIMAINLDLPTLLRSVRNAKAANDSFSDSYSILDGDRRRRESAVDQAMVLASFVYCKCAGSSEVPYSKLVEERT